VRAFWRRRLACRDVVELVTDYLEGALDRSGRLRFEVHLSGCPDCTEYVRQMRMTIAVTRRLEVGDLRPELQRQFAVLYRRWKLESG
jgi:anti-sigma factor RsiW